MINWKRKCIFVHIPKTGGSTIERIIWPKKSQYNLNNLYGIQNKLGRPPYQQGPLQHLKSVNIIKAVGENTFRDYFKFSFVRNPWDKAVSQFAYMKGRPNLQKRTGMPKHVEFKKYLELTQRREHVHWAAQHTFIINEHGELMVDYLGRFEHFENHLFQVLKKLSLDTVFFNLKKRKIPVINSSERSHYHNYYDDESREMVAHFCSEDIKIFNYGFHDDDAHH